jgi:hypothetical protein
MKKELISEIQRIKELLESEKDNSGESQNLTKPKFVYVLDVEKKHITSPYGMRTYKGITRMHHGLDLRAKSGTNVLAMTDGTVVYAKFLNDDCGGQIKIDHGIIDGKKIHTRFCHIKQLNVEAGDKVIQGQVIGLSGGYITDKGAGNSENPHLHWEVGENGTAVNPEPYFNLSVQSTGKAVWKNPNKTEVDSKEKKTWKNPKSSDLKQTEKETETKNKEDEEKLDPLQKILKGAKNFQEKGFEIDFTKSLKDVLEKLK